jgi:signal transduction histidine kinase
MIQEKEFPAIIKMNTIQGLEREFVKKDGTTFTASMNVFNEADGAGDLIKTRTIVRDVSEWIRVEAELKRSREDLRNLSAHIESAREEERGRIAREVHDELGVTLSKLKLDIAWLEKRLTDNRLLLDKTRTMFDLVDDTISSVQKISSELRPGVLDHLGLSAAIKWQAGEFRDRAGIQCVLSVLPEDIELDQDLSIAIFRIFQETLSNVVRHAEATRVEVDLLAADGILTLEVRDNGKGITEEQISNPTSFGIMGIRERVGFLGGRLEIKGIPGEGTIVAVSIPLLEPIRQG